MLSRIHILCISMALVTGQNTDIKELVEGFFTNNTSDQTGNLVLVTTPQSNGFGAVDKCGEGADEGIHICVSYFQCDGITNTIIQDGRTDGFGLIDIRFGANECPHYLDVCCKLPNQTIKDPETNVPVNPPSSTSVPPVVTPTSSRPTTTSTAPVTPRPSSVYCGIRNPNGIDFKIDKTRDREAEYGEFPWMVGILKTTPGLTYKDASICGGSLIAPNVVLTGAHCVTDRGLGDYKVRAGEWDTQTEKERLPYQERTVGQVIIHEDYVPKVLYNNIALLILSRPFDQADNIGTICLPNQNEVISSRNCLASGWGKNVFGKEGRFQMILKKIELPTVPFVSCQQALRTTRLGQSYVLHPSFMCAGGEEGQDTCTGDGGSPLVCPDSRTPGRYVQAGIVSWGIGCGVKGNPGVYANIPKFRNWIDEKLSRLSISTNPYNV